MKRDMELIRTILRELEIMDAETVLSICDLKATFPNISRPTLHLHLTLLEEAGLIEVDNPIHSSGVLNMAMLRLTWDGYDFLAASNDNIWQKTKVATKEKGLDLLTSVPFKMLKDLLEKTIANELM